MATGGRLHLRADERRPWQLADASTSELPAAAMVSRKAAAFRWGAQQAPPAMESRPGEGGAMGAHRRYPSAAPRRAGRLTARQSLFLLVANGGAREAGAGGLGHGRVDGRRGKLDGRSRGDGQRCGVDLMGRDQGSDWMEDFLQPSPFFFCFGCKRVGTCGCEFAWL
ncbi:unnamed protein product [Urochloa humidicola]